LRSWKPTMTLPSASDESGKFAIPTRNLGNELPNLRPPTRSRRYSLVPSDMTSVRPFAIWQGSRSSCDKNTGSLLNERSQRYVMVILESAQRMDNLIDDLLVFSRISRTETHKTRSAWNNLPKKLCRSSEGHLRAQSCLAGGGLPPWYRDRSMLRLGACQSDLECRKIHQHALAGRNRNRMPEPRTRSGSGVC
jgi:hypothetical protein